MTKQRAIRTAVIGAGPAAQMLHLPVLATLRDAGEIALSCICDIDSSRAKAAQRKFAFATSNSDAAATAANDEIDAVYIFGTATMHHRYGLLALEHGKHVFVEKPIAPDYNAAMQFAEAAASRNLIAVGGHNRRFYKGLELLRARSGKAGWTFAEVFAHKPEFGKVPAFGARSWLAANGIHALDALVYIMDGLPETLFAFTGRKDGTATYSALLRWKNGAKAIFSCNNSAGTRREAFVLHAPDETCRLEEERLVIHARGKTSAMPMPMLKDGFAAEHAEFLRAIRHGTAPRHVISALAPSLYLAERIEEGHQGDIALPHAPLHPARAGLPIGGAILVVQAGPLQAALSRLPPDVRLLAPEDVARSPVPLADVRGAILGRGATALDMGVIDKLPNLAVVGVMGLSLAHYEPERLLKRGIALVHASKAYAETVADFAFALAVLARRRAFLSHEAMRRGGWGTSLPQPGIKLWLRLVAKKLRPVLSTLGLEVTALAAWKHMHSQSGGTGVAHDMSGTRVGLVGWSANARAFAERLLRVGAKVSVYSEHAPENSFGGAVRATLAEVLAADIVSLHRGLTPETYHFLGRAELDRLRSGTVLINIARGALIAPDALLARLCRGDIFACLDTYEDEPLSRREPLRALPNVFLTSHIAGGSPEMHAAAAEEVVDKVAAWFDGDRSAAISSGKLKRMS